MDVVGLLLSLIFKSILVMLPMTVAWLAFRRLFLSNSANAWLYAVCGLFGTITAAGLLPWALSITGTSWLFFVLAAFSPALWLGVVLICDAKRVARYAVDDTPPPAPTFQSWRKRARDAAAPLVLENPDWPGTPMPIFRHSRPANDHIPDPTGRAEATKRSLMSIAREMRGNETSEARRPKLLPPPMEKEVRQLPFLKDAVPS